VEPTAHELLIVAQATIGIEVVLVEDLQHNFAGSASP
jgi:hypothetical protein